MFKNMTFAFFNYSGRSIDLMGEVVTAVVERTR